MTTLSHPETCSCECSRSYLQQARDVLEEEANVLAYCLHDEKSMDRRLVIAARREITRLRTIAEKICPSVETPEREDE